MSEFPMKNYQNIPATVLVTGANILGLEIIASRLMAPTFGNSIFIWGGILSVTMLCLALGYAWGGSLADKPDVPSRKLVLHILLSAAWISLVPVFNGFIMKGGLGLGHYLGPILVSLVILGPPLTLLSTAVPLGFGIRLQTRQSKPGKSVGRLFAISTAGSIVGALITAYFLVPFLGVRSSFFFLTGSLILTLSPSLCRNQFLKSATLILFLLVLVRQLPPAYRVFPSTHTVSGNCTGKRAGMDIAPSSKTAGSKAVYCFSTAQARIGLRGPNGPSRDSIISI